MPDPTDKRIEELWQYIPPYTAPNHPPQVKVITTTNTGDTPMTEEDPDLLAGDNLDRLRGRGPYSAMSERFRLTEELENARYENNLLAQKCRELEKENFHLAANQCHSGYAGEYGHHRCSEIDRLTKERDEARWEVCGFHHLTGFLAGDYANSRGWNYFNDERKWPKFPQSVTDFKLFLEGQDKIFLESNDRLRKERDEARRLLKAVVDMMRDNMAPDATHPKHVCDFIYCPEIATCMVCENWTDALVMCYPDDFQDEEETK